MKFCVREVEGSYYVEKTKALVSFRVTAGLICVFVFIYAKSQFSHDSAHMIRLFESGIRCLYIYLEVMWNNLLFITIV